MSINLIIIKLGLGLSELLKLGAMPDWGPSRGANNCEILSNLSTSFTPKSKAITSILTDSLFRIISTCVHVLFKY